MRSGPRICPAALPIVDRSAAGRPASRPLAAGRGDRDLDRRRRARWRRHGRSRRALSRRDGRDHDPGACRQWRQHTLARRAMSRAGDEILAAGCRADGGADRRAQPPAGSTTVSVHRAPRVTILVTGTELRRAGGGARARPDLRVERDHARGRAAGVGRCRRAPGRGGGHRGGARGRARAGAHGRRRRHLGRRLRRPARPGAPGRGASSASRRSSGASRCGPASRSPSASAGRRSCSACRGTRSRLSSAACSSCDPRCSRSRAIPIPGRTSGRGTLDARGAAAAGAGRLCPRQDRLERGRRRARPDRGPGVAHDRPHDDGRRDRPRAAWRRSHSRRARGSATSRSKPRARPARRPAGSAAAVRATGAVASGRECPELRRRRRPSRSARATVGQGMKPSVISESRYIGVSSPSPSCVPITTSGEGRPGEPDPVEHVARPPGAPLDLGKPEPGVERGDDEQQAVGADHRRRDGHAAQCEERHGVARRAPRRASAARPAPALSVRATSRRRRAPPRTMRPGDRPVGDRGAVRRRRDRRPAREEARPARRARRAARTRARRRIASAARARRPGSGSRRRRLRAKRSIAPTRNGTSATSRTSSSAQPRTMRLPR